MRRIAQLIFIITLASFFMTAKNSTIEVKSCEVIYNGKSKQWLIRTVDNATYIVPNNSAFNWDAIVNYMTLNLKPERTWNSLQATGVFHVRTYGIRSLFSSDGTKIIRVLESIDDKPTLVIMFDALKEIAMFFIDGMKDEAVSISDEFIEEVKEFEKDITIEDINTLAQDVTN